MCGLDMRLFIYTMNRENLSGWYGGSKGTFYWMAKALTPWEMKIYHHTHAMHKIPNAGWHFNTMGGKDLSLYKWLCTGPIYFPGVEEALIDLGNKPDLLEQSYNGHIQSNTIVVPIDNSYPKYFLDNIDHFSKLGWISE